MACSNSRMPRIHLYLAAPPADARLLLPAEASHHLLRVLRARRGQGLTLFSGDGWEHAAELVGVEGERAVLAVEAARQRDTASPLHVTLALPLLKGERWDWALQKATELGVATIQPIHSRFCQIALAEAQQARRQERWQQILIAAAEQSQATRLPQLAAPLALADFLARPLEGLGLVLDADADGNLRTLPEISPNSVTILTGPEGGLAAEEIASAREKGFYGLRLGPRILRAETAPLAILAVLQGRYGDLG
ncbi:MAG: 16S rRNA (uracil(1498)-N(3))-methyltransferase [Candidatus Igneacidithiobacillus chanchocoensis]